MTRAEAIEVLRGHARSAVCTLEARDCAKLVEALTQSPTAIKLEREACAVIVDRLVGGHPAGQRAAEEIRARGGK